MVRALSREFREYHAALERNFKPGIRCVYIGLILCYLNVKGHDAFIAIKMLRTSKQTSG